MVPERLLGDQPAKRAAYIMIGLALIVIGLGAWNWTLSERLGEQESIRRAEARSAAARQQLGCVVFSTLYDVSIAIPLTNLNDILAGNTLTPAEREDRMQARARYQAAADKLAATVAACTR